MVGSKVSHFWNAYIEFLHRLAPVGGGGEVKIPNQSVPLSIVPIVTSLSISIWYLDPPVVWVDNQFAKKGSSQVFYQLWGGFVPQLWPVLDRLM